MNPNWTVLDHAFSSHDIDRIFEVLDDMVATYGLKVLEERLTVVRIAAKMQRSYGEPTNNLDYQFGFVEGYLTTTKKHHFLLTGEHHATTTTGPTHTAPHDPCR